MISIALDAFGGDNAPDVVVQGAINAVNSSEGKFAVVLCGPEAEVKAKLKEFGYEGKLIQVVDAPELVAMDEHPTEVLRKKQHSGLVMCVGLQKKGLVQASVSAGNSGAMMASCLMILGRTSEDFARPALSRLLRATAFSWTPAQTWMKSRMSSETSLSPVLCLQNPISVSKIRRSGF